jgi:hypothetical protein
MQSAALEDISFSPAAEEGGDEIVTLSGTFTFSSSDIAFAPNSQSFVEPVVDTTTTSETSTSEDDTADTVDSIEEESAVIDDTI